MMKSPLLRTVAVASCLALPVVSRADCRKAQDDEVPHGANELIELKEQRTHGLFGTVLFPVGEPAEDVVVEVYPQMGKQDHAEVVKHKRLLACVPGSDGRFSFPELKPGRYLLQAGMRVESGVNITYVIVDMKSNAGSRHKGQGIRIPLHLGT